MRSGRQLAIRRLAGQWYDRKMSGGRKLRRRRRLLGSRIVTGGACLVALHIPGASAADPLPEKSTSASAEMRTEEQTEGAEFFTLSYQAPVGCPERAQFEELVRSLTSAAHFREPGHL